MTSAPIILPGAWALGDGVDLAMPTLPMGLHATADPVAGVWSSILNSVSVALHMMGWKWDCSQAASRMRIRRYSVCSQNSSCALETLDSEFSDSDSSEEAMLERPTQMVCSGLSKQSYGKED
ncbi:hypothetical protein Vretimale_5314 [Volvox reticuliferus]|uniref:Uncharacterized protein n=1 Tax=Volvox reticuliferus TaxID=1737510 RepID=A0A8J4DDY9_9CHLO|nr:hypothetical protein Vretifemale_3927 [Volvox reticuliferus]GIM00138.1 hypothetical protein Vretimale_5314 [Volvox reticuliferus]